MASDDPYRSPDYERPKAVVIPTFLSWRGVVVAIVAIPTLLGGIAGALVGHVIGEAADQFHLTYFGTPPRTTIVAETLVGLVAGALLCLIVVSAVYWICRRLHLGRRA